MKKSVAKERHRHAQWSHLDDEIAAREGVTLRRMQIVVKDILAPGAGLHGIEISGAAGQPPERGDDGRLSARWRAAIFQQWIAVVELVKEMDRYHGFFPERRRRRGSGGPARPPRAEAPLALAAPKAMEMTPANVEKARSAIGMASARRRKRRRRRVGWKWRSKSEKARLGNGDGGSHSCSRAVPGGLRPRGGSARPRPRPQRGPAHLQSALVLEFEGLPKLF